MSSKLKISLFLGSALLLAGCAHVSPTASPSVTAEPRIGVTPRNQIVPLLDAHQHVMGPGAMALTRREPSPPPVTVPPALASLLAAREKGVDQASYAGLYTPDAQLYAEEQGRWWLGQARILDALGNFGTEWRFVPTSYALDGTAGYVAGVLRTTSGQDTHNFVLGVTKSADGAWRIRSEMKQPIARPAYAPVIDADKVIEVLDDAGIKYGVVLSVAYWFGDPEKQVADRYAGTRAENDWMIAQTAKYPDRLIPFCGVNPVADYAIAEVERCAAIPRVRGMKIHRNSKFDLSQPDQLERLRQFFRAANRHGLAIVFHLRGSVETIINEVLPEAPDVPIQIAHMASSFDQLRMFADAIEAGKPGTRNLYFDWTQALPIEGLWGSGPSEGLSGSVSAETKAEVAALMRRVGLDRVLYGSDMPLAWNPTPREWWRKTILTLPLSDDEIRDIADNRPPYLPSS